MIVESIDTRGKRFSETLKLIDLQMRVENGIKDIHQILTEVGLGRVENEDLAMIGGFIPHQIGNIPELYKAVFDKQVEEGGLLRISTKQTSTGWTLEVDVLNRNCLHGLRSGLLIETNKRRFPRPSVVKVSYSSSIVLPEKISKDEDATILDERFLLSCFPMFESQSETLRLQNLYATFADKFLGWARTQVGRELAGSGQL